MRGTNLKERWLTLIRRCGCRTEAAEPEFQRLLDAYGEPHRVYHSLEHLAQVFAALDTVPLNDLAVEWAVWYHDAWYRPGDPENEARSAELAGAALARLAVPSELSAEVVRLIASTATHSADGGDLAQQWFLDADLSILGAAEDEYTAYHQAVRREHAELPDAAYRAGRLAFVLHMLARPSIFLTKQFSSRLEDSARKNLGAELASLLRVQE